jgi:hypothetical protein
VDERAHWCQGTRLEDEYACSPLLGSHSFAVTRRGRRIRPLMINFITGPIVSMIKQDW